MIFKLEMAKAFDKGPWDFLCQAIRQSVFSEIWIDMIARLISNNWFSNIINGVRHEFFKSSRGLNQGDPRSLSLFVFIAELLSILMDLLHRIISSHIQSIGVVLSSLILLTLTRISSSPLGIFFIFPR